MIYTQILRGLILRGIPASLWITGLPPVYAQSTSVATTDLTAKRLKLTAKQKSMSDMIAMLSEQLGCSIIADDTPLKKQADVDVEGTGKEVLDRVAETFDYAWALNRRGIVVMSKAFKDPNDAPQASVPEMRKMAQQAIAALRAFPTDPDSKICSGQARQLYNLFSPEQKTQLQSGKHLHVSDMTPDQSALVQRIVLNELLAGTIPVWERMLNMLDALPSATLQYKTTGIYSDFYYHWFSPQNPSETTLLTGWRGKEPGQP